jgi:MFS transporter, FHS family, L-fucose permease
MTAAPSAAANRRAALMVLCAVFIIVGLLSATLGPSLPDLADRTGRSLAELGRLFSAMFAGSLVAQILGGRASDRFGRRIVLVVGCLLCAAGTAGVAASRAIGLTLASAAILGVGFGGATLSVNVMAAELSPRRRASAVNLVNVFYGMGAIAGPLVAGLFLERTGSAIPAIWISVALILLMVPLTARGLPAAVPAMATPVAPATSPRAGNPRAFIFTCGLFLMVYVGLEWAVGAWAAVYLQRSTSLDAAGAATATAVFWFSLSAGRMLAVLAGMNVAAERLLTMAVCVAVAGGVALWAGHGLAWASVAALAVIGLAFGPVYPTGIAIVTGRFPQAAATATSRIGVLAAVGGMALPWTLGLVLTHGTTLDAARLIAALIAVMLLLWWRVYQLEQRALHTGAHRP